MFDQFSYDEYGRLLDMVKTGRENLCFSDFHDSDAPLRYFLLRHDVDFSPRAALKMARFEAQRGVRATYFLLLSSEHYNLLSEDSCSIPRQLIALGHEVGLHYDVRAMGERASEDLRAQLQYEIYILSRLAGNAICSIAMHNPSAHGDDPFANDTHFTSAYDPRFTKAIAYYSDSCGAWRDHAYYAFRESKIPDRLQLLIHPFFWAELPGNRWERLNTWVEESGQKLSEYQEQIRDLWLNHSGVREHENRLTRA